MYAGAMGYFRRVLEVDPSCKECRYNLKQVENIFSGGKGRD